MKKLTFAVTGAALSLLLVGTALAAPATSNAVGMANVNVLSQANAWEDSILSSSIKTSEQKDLIAGVSLECGLYTRTKVAGKKGSKSTSNAHAKVEVAVIIDMGTADERYAAPGLVTFCEREQELSAILGGVLESCTVLVDPDTGEGGFTKEDCDFTDEEIELVLRTMNANHFNFILTDLGAAGAEGHTVDVRARVATVETGSTSDGNTGDADDGSYEAEANATIGNGSLVVDEVRLARSINLQGTP